VNHGILAFNNLSTLVFSLKQTLQVTLDFGVLGPMELIVRLKFVLHLGDFCMEIVFPKHNLAFNLADDRSFVKAVTFEAGNATFTLGINVVEVVDLPPNHCDFLICLLVNPGNVILGQNLRFVRSFTNVLLQLVHSSVCLR
jgi:hypothetical protein